MKSQAKDSDPFPSNIINNNKTRNTAETFALNHSFLIEILLHILKERLLSV